MSLQRKLVLAVGLGALSLTFGVSSRFAGAESPVPLEDVVVEPDGSILVTGVFQGAVDFDPGPEIDTRTAVGGFDVFVTKYDSEGRYLWTRTVGGPGDDDPTALRRRGR